MYKSPNLPRWRFGKVQAQKSLLDIVVLLWLNEDCPLVKL